MRFIIYQKITQFTMVTHMST